MCSVKLGIIGNGVVGSATANAWRDYCEVRQWDIHPEKCTHKFSEVVECNYVMVCVPTPESGYGPLDTTYIDAVAEELSEHKPTMAVIRSTLNIGDTERFEKESGWPTLFYPEFLTERTAEHDAKNPICSIIGGGDAEFAEHVRKVGKRNPVSMPPAAAEMVKIASNAYGAVIVSMMNEMYDIAESKGVDWDAFRQGMLATGRVLDVYSHVPGPDGKRGFGGKCWPKDLSALIASNDAGGLTLRAARGTNGWIRPSEVLA